MCPLLSVLGQYFGRMIHRMKTRATTQPPSAKARRGRRPGFPIAGQLLAELTDAQDLEREQLHRLAFPKPVIADDSRRRAWSRWETTGVMKDRASAQAVADVLRTTITALQGGAPEPAPNRVEELAQQLRRQAEAGNAEALAVLANVAAEDDPSPSVAEGMATRIELAQLTRQVDRLNELSRATGWSMRELEQPANLHGYWLVASESTIGTATTHIVIGIDAAMWHVDREVMSWLYPAGTEHPSTADPDVRLVFREEEPWFRVHLEHPSRTWANRTLSMVRCEPGESGLRWTQPSRYDRSEIERLPFRFWSHSNFVEGLAAGASLKDLRRLRLVIQRYRPRLVAEALESGKPEPLPEIVAVVEGDLPDLEEDRLEQFRVHGGGQHPLVVNWIAQGVWAELRNQMECWPRECWQLCAFEGAIGIHLNTRPYLAIQQLGRKPVSETRYRINLVALTDDGSLRDQPWRSDGVTDTIKLLDRCMQDLPDTPPWDSLFVGPPRPEGWLDPADD